MLWKKWRRDLCAALSGVVIGSFLYWFFSGPTFHFTVDYDASIKDLITAGDYEVVDERVRNNFPKHAWEVGKRRRSFRLFAADSDKMAPFGGNNSAKDGRGEPHHKDVLDRMEQEGYRPATFVELLAFGERNPDLQKDYWIIAWGSQWDFKANWDRHSDRTYFPWLYLNWKIHRLTILGKELKWESKVRTLECGDPSAFNYHRRFLAVKKE